MKNILFIYDKFNTGGIETLILRMSEWLIKNNFNVTIIMKRGGEITKQLNKNIKMIELNKSYSYLYFPLLPQIILSKYHLNKIDYIMSFHPKSNWIASNIIKSLNLKCKYISGIYHPKAYYSDGMHLSEKIVFKLLLKKNDTHSLLFMNEDSKKLHEKNLQISFKESSIWPLPVSKKMFQNIQKNTKKYLIVSIGRLAPFKTYNLYMIDIVKRLIDEGYDVTYEIYGTGILHNEIIKKINKHNLKKRIKLKGLLKYSKFKMALQDAYLFVGMGTSAIEASFCKVPTIVSIESNTQAKTYGYIHELPYYNVGEENDELKEKDIFALIKATLDLSEDEYIKLCDSGFNYVQKYSIEFLMPKWIHNIKNINSCNIKIPIYLKLIYFILEIINPILKLFKRKKQ